MLQFIEEPKVCPCCQYPLVKVNDQLFCRNSACPAQSLKKLEHYCKTLRITGLGPKTLEKLELQEITELYYLTTEVVADAVGPKVAEKLIASIEASKTNTFSKILEAFAVPLIGGTASEKIAEVCSNFEEITEESLIKAGIGEKARANLLEWLQAEYQELREFLPAYNFITANPSTTGPKVCITGKLKSFKTKALAYEKLKEKGFTVVETVTKDLDYLIDEEGGNSSKRQKADTYKITILDDLNDLLQT